MCGGGGGGGSGRYQAIADITNAREKREYEEKLRQENLRQQEAQRQREEQERRQQEAEFERMLNAAQGNAKASAESYFSDRGVGIDDYYDDIERAVEQARLSVPQGAGDVGSYFSGIGESVYDKALSAHRTRASSGLDDFFYDGFEYDRIADTADDPIIDAVLNERREAAMTSLDNLRKRGVLTDTGYGAAEKALGEQGYTAKSLLEEIGNAQLAAGRNNLVTIGNRAKSRIPNLNLGDTFDPTSYVSQVDAASGDFFADLGDAIRGSIQEGDLFNLDKAFARGGVAQGAQNTPFDPAASAGNFAALTANDEDDEEKRKKSASNPFQVANAL